MTSKDSSPLSSPVDDENVSVGSSRNPSKSRSASPDRQSGMPHGSNFESKWTRSRLSSRSGTPTGELRLGKLDVKSNLSNTLTPSSLFGDSSTPMEITPDMAVDSYFNHYDEVQVPLPSHAHGLPMVMGESMDMVKSTDSIVSVSKWVDDQGRKLINMPDTVVSIDKSTRTVFTKKPKTALWIAVGMLGLLTLGLVGYFVVTGVNNGISSSSQPTLNVDDVSQDPHVAREKPSAKTTTTMGQARILAPYMTLTAVPTSSRSAPQAIPTSVLTTAPHPVPSALAYTSGRTAPLQFNTISLRCNGATDDFTCPLVVKNAFARMMNRLKVSFPSVTSTTRPLVLKVQLTDVRNIAPIPGVDESHSLSGTLNSLTAPVTLTASNQWGALRGLNSLWQMITTSSNPSFPAASSAVTFTLPANGFALSDKPAYPWRGIVLDTARHFISPNSIKRMLDGMEVSKGNVLHWHIYDDQSFPLQVPELTNLTRYSAFVNTSTSGNLLAYTTSTRTFATGANDALPRLTYSAQDIIDIATYARARGIMVLPELEGPGHQSSMGWVFPSLFSCPVAAYPKGTQINPFQTGSRTLMETIWSACSDKGFANSPDALSNQVNLNTANTWGGSAAELPFVHLGLDEVEPWCWGDAPGAPTNYDYSTTLLSTYWQWAKDFFTAVRGKRVLVWEDVIIDRNVPLDGTSGKGAGGTGTIVQLWRTDANQARAKTVMQKGYEILVSPENYWYFTCGQWCTPGTGSMSYSYAWSYTLPPTPRALNGVKPGTALGGEAAFWTEETREDVLDKVVWPRASAVFERLWSNPSSKYTNALVTVKRINFVNGLLATVGISAWPGETVIN